MTRRVAVAAAVLLACRPQPPAQTVDSAHTGTDTLRGVLVMEGSDPFPTPTLRTSSGRFIIDASNVQLLNLTQLDLWLRGVRTAPDRFRADQYRVRGANGAPAWDGVLRSGSAGLQLELADGSLHPVRGAPSSLAQLTGSRLWLTENLDGSLREYGVIQQKPGA